MKCRDCPDAVFHGTGSTVLVNCRFVVGWRDVNSKCVLERKGLKRREGNKGSRDHITDV